MAETKLAGGFIGKFEDGKLAGFSLRLDLSGLERGLGEAFDRVMEDVISGTARDAGSLAPRKSGLLSSSIKSNAKGSGLSRRGFVFTDTAAGPKGAYGLWVEIGTGIHAHSKKPRINRPAQPFLRPALDRNKQKLLIGMTNAI